MKYIFIDSNIFHNLWLLDSADFRLLSNFIKNSSSTLLLSELVCQEVQNLYKRNFEKTVDEFKKSITKTDKFLAKKITLDVDSLNENYNFKNICKEKFEFIEWVEFTGIPNEILVQRAIERKLPFRGENEKGFRDSLIWLSLVKYLAKKSKEDEIIFISLNLNDFYNADKSDFHEDLLNDLKMENVKALIKPYLTLNSFIEELKLKDEEFTNEKINESYLYEIESQIEEITEDYISNLSTSEFKKLMESSKPKYFFLPFLISHDFYINEGIEDPEVVDYIKISSDSIYITYKFNLRNCDFDFTIPETEYYKMQEKLDRYKSASYLAEDEYHNIIFCRAYFTVNFIYNLETKTISGFEINTLQIKDY